MVNQQLTQLRKENLELLRIRRILIKDCKDLSSELERFYKNFAGVLLKKQLEIEKLKEKLK